MLYSLFAIHLKYLIKEMENRKNKILIVVISTKIKQYKMHTGEKY